MGRPGSLRVAGLILVSLCAGQLPLNAQRAGTVRGVVVNAITGAPVPQVVVSILDRTLQATTDERGRYVIGEIVPGLIRLHAQKIGFHPVTTAHYAVLSDSVVLADFKLAPLAVNLDPVEVTGERPEHRAAIGAKVMTAKDLPSGNLLTALQGVVAGLQTSGRRDDVTVRMRHSSAEVLYVIDGTVVTPPLTFHIDTQDVQCVEIRSGYRAAQEYRQSINSQPYSGLILVWTRGSVAPMPRECAQPSS